MPSFFRSRLSLYIQAFFYAFAGLYHFLNPDFYVAIMPTWFPEKNLLNSLSGLLEILSAVGLLIPRTRKLAVYTIIFLLNSFFTVHISHFFEPPVLDFGNFKIDFSQKPTYYGLYVRFLLHFFLIWWAWQLRKIRI
ncbi:MAG: hypothetical protein ACK40K_01465 [Raineya sp.]